MGGEVSVPYKKLGAWVVKQNQGVSGTVYQALTDGFVLGLVDPATNQDIYLHTDSANPPTTLRFTGTTGHVAQPGVMSPIRKNDYYKVTSSAGQTVTVFWIPLEP